MASGLSALSAAAELAGQEAKPPALVSAALGKELAAAQDLSHLMRYRLEKTTPRLEAVREIYETKDGDVARLVEVNGKPLSAEDAAKEEARLEELAADGGRQRHRKQQEEGDRERALKVLRALPEAFVYTDLGAGEAGGVTVERFSFEPNPGFHPAELETQILVAMRGEMWIDSAAQRVVRLEGHLMQDVDFGWGILGRLDKGGWIRIEQAEVLPGEWRTVKLEMKMSGRVVWKARVFDTVQVESGFAPVSGELGYREAVAALAGK